MQFHPNDNFEGGAIPAINAPKDYGLEGIAQLTIKTQKNEDFLLWKSRKLTPGKPTLVLFPGSVGHLGDTHMGKNPGSEDTLAYVRLIKEAQKNGMQVVAVNHVGYANSTSAPSQEAFHREAETTMDYLLGEGFKPNDIYTVGISLGTNIASHAAQHLSQKSAFKRDSKQHINLLLSSGTISAPAAINDSIPILPKPYLNHILHQQFNTGQELRAMAANTDTTGRIHVHYVRATDDEHTPAYHENEHRQAAGGLDFSASEATGGHFMPAEAIMAQVMKQRQETMQRGSASGRAL